jgi:hypothetical protein
VKYVDEYRHPAAAQAYADGISRANQGVKLMETSGQRLEEVAGVAKDEACKHSSVRADSLFLLLAHVAPLNPKGDS